MSSDNDLERTVMEVIVPRRRGMGEPTCRWTHYTEDTLGMRLGEYTEDKLGTRQGEYYKEDTLGMRQGDWQPA